MRRVVSLYLPNWATDRHVCTSARRGNAGWRDKPFAIIASVAGRRLVMAASPAAAACGIRPGLPLTDARALLPELAAIDADATGDAEALAAFADWCGRFTPWTAPDGADGVWLDVTGCAHLVGGEAALVEALLAAVTGLGFAARAALAETPGAAWAIARHGRLDIAQGRGAVLPPGRLAEALAPLPVAALRLAPAVAEDLTRLGLKHIADVKALPRATLTKRFGGEVALRLDQAFGRAGESLSPLRPAPQRWSRLGFAEPILTAEAIAAAARHLLEERCRALAAEGVGARRLELALYRTDGCVVRVAVGTASPSRDPRHLARLLAERLPEIDPGLGIEVAVLATPEVERLAPRQLALRAAGRLPAGVEADYLAVLADRLENRLGRGAVKRLAPVASHCPERAQRAAPAPARMTGAWPAGAARPIRLLPRPEAIEATAPVPDDPPVLFRWRRRLYRVARADGPERIAEEWWRDDAVPGDVRDYYRVEDAEGRRFWLYRAGLYRAGAAPRWFLHGLFA